MVDGEAEEKLDEERAKDEGEGWIYQLLRALPLVRNGVGARVCEVFLTSPQAYYMGRT